jgi:hypothetical protein
MRAAIQYVVVVVASWWGGRDRLDALSNSVKVQEIERGAFHLKRKVGCNC